MGFVTQVITVINKYIIYRFTDSVDNVTEVFVFCYLVSTVWERSLISFTRYLSYTVATRHSSWRPAITENQGIRNHLIKRVWPESTSFNITNVIKNWCDFKINSYMLTWRLYDINSPHVINVAYLYVISYQKSTFTIKKLGRCTYAGRVHYDVTKLN